MSKDGLKLKSDDIAGVYLHAWFWCFMSHFWGSPSNPRFSHFLYNHSTSIAFLGHLDFLEWLLIANIPGRVFKYFLLQFPQAPITPAFNFSLKCARHTGLILFASFLTSPCASVSTPSFWERLHLYLPNVWKGNGWFQQFGDGYGKEFEKTELGVPRGRGDSIKEKETGAISTLKSSD